MGRVSKFFRDRRRAKEALRSLRARYLPPDAPSDARVPPPHDVRERFLEICVIGAGLPFHALVMHGLDVQPLPSRNEWSVRHPGLDGYLCLWVHPNHSDSATLYTGWERRFTKGKRVRHALFSGTKDECLAHALKLLQAMDAARRLGAK